MRISALVAVAALSTLAFGCGKSISVSVQDPNSVPTPATPQAPAATNQNSAIAATAPSPTPKTPASAAPTPATPPATISTATNANHYFVQTQNGGALNVLASTSSNAAVVGTVPNGTQVLMHLSDRSGEWLEISAPGNLRGWAAATDLIDRNGNSASPSLTTAAQRLANSTKANELATSGNSQTYRVKTMDGTGLNLRAKPQLDGKVLTIIADGETVTEVGTVGQWTEVLTSKGTRGYVASDYLVAN